MDKEPPLILKPFINKADPTIRKRKRKQLIDEQKTISSDQMRAQLQDTRDIVTPVDLAPATLKLMILKENSSFEKMWNMPGYMGDDIEAPPFSNKILVVSFHVIDWLIDFTVDR